MSGWDSVGGDPCPGSVGALRTHADALRAVGDHGRDIEQRLASLHRDFGSLRWTGAGADNVATLVQTSVPDLTRFWTAHHDAGSAMTTFADRLEDHQSQARSALLDYETASSDLAAARAAADDASRRAAVAAGQLNHYDLQLTGLSAQYTLATATLQPTAGLDEQVRLATAQRDYQARLQSQAHADAAASGARIADAEQRQQTAHKRIETLRDETRSDAQWAAGAILSAVGIVESHNPLVRAFDHTVGAVKGAGHWLADNADVLIKAWDEVTSIVSALALVCLPIPVLGEILGVAAVAMSVVSLIGHVYQAANGTGSWWGVGLDAVLLANPFGRALGKMAKTGAEEFDNVPGIVKRLAYFDDARKAKGALSSSGTKIVGDYRYRVYVVPKNVTGSDSVYRTLLVLKGGTRVYEDARTLNDARETIDDWTSPGPGGAPSAPAPPSVQDGPSGGFAPPTPAPQGPAPNPQGPALNPQGPALNPQGPPPPSAAQVWR